MFKTINDITIEEVNDAAQKNADEYDHMFQRAARAAFIEGVLWAQKAYNTNRPRYTAQP